ncbi:MAG: hypothetical protein IPP48_02640 [Chitinophagaceae bacterium]|nr:hypothetical protein [Chitinophagaceae bacterium]
MKYINLSKKIAGLMVAVAIFSSCDKVEKVTGTGDSGKTLVKLLQGGTPANIVKTPVDFVPTPTKIVGVDIRRDIANSEELNKTMVVTIKDDTAAVTAANPGYIKLPTSWYSYSVADGSKTGGEGGVYTVTLKPGEFAKQIYITIPNATLLNPSSLYALGFTILTCDAGSVLSTQKSVVVEIGAKNNWDGVYEQSGTFLDVSNAAFTYDAPQQYSLITVGASTCIVRNDDLNGGIPGYVFSNAGAGTYYGSYGLVISFNPATNVISDLHNYYGDPAFPATSGGTPASGTGAPLYAASNGRRAVLDPSGLNKVQGKDIIIKH